MNELTGIIIRFALLNADFVLRSRYKHCGGFPKKCLQARLSLWEKFFKQQHEASARVLVNGAPLSVWLNVWQQASPVGLIAAHLVNYRTNGTLDCNMSVPQPQSGPTECDCSCEVQPHDNSVVNEPVPVAFTVSLRINASDWSASSSAVAWLYSPDHPALKLRVERDSKPGFLSATVPQGMGVYSIVAFASCDAEVQARTDASSTRKALERLLMANASAGVSLFGTGAGITASRLNAMTQADQLLSQIQGEETQAMSPNEYEAISVRLKQSTAVLQKLLFGIRSSVTTAATTQRESVASLCATPGR
jgi:hypothetical protein